MATHSMCSSCWTERYPNDPTYPDSDAVQAICCYCFANHWSGIYVRDEDPSLRCRHEIRSSSRDLRTCCYPGCKERISHVLMSDTLGEECAHLVCVKHAVWPEHTAHVITTVTPVLRWLT